MSSDFLQTESDIAIAAARQASTAILDVYATDFDVDYKDRREPVTHADRLANRLLCEFIGREFPNDAIVAEESAPADSESLLALTSQERVWFIDPIDGTKEFIARNGEFSVMIGLCLRGRPMLGVVMRPSTGQLWLGIVGRGAWVHDGDGAVRELHVSETSAMSEATVVLSRSHRSNTLSRVIEKLGAGRQVPYGSIGLKAALIAERQADLYINLYAPGGAKLWDGCAPEALVCAAGGRVTTTEGLPSVYVQGVRELIGGMVASNGCLHEQVLAATKPNASP